MPTLKSKAGRTYENGKPLTGDLRAIIIDELEQKFNGNKENISVKRGAFSEVSKTFRISNPTASSIWKKYCMYTIRRSKAPWST